MIKLEQGELNCFAIMSEKGALLQQGIEQVQSSQRAFIKLLEIKYNAVYDEKTGQFFPKE